MSTFELYCPDPLTRFDLTEDVEAEIRRNLDPFVRSVPLTKQPVVRELMDNNVKPSLLELAAGGATCVLMAVNPWVDSPVRPVIAITPLDLDAPAPEVLAALQAIGEEDPTARVVDLNGLVALRVSHSRDVTEQIAAAFDRYEQSATEAQHAAPGRESDLPEIPDIVTEPATAPDIHQVGVQYVFGDASAESGTPWMSAQLSFDHPTGTAGEELAQGWIEIFDSMMTTFRWTA